MKEPIAIVGAGCRVPGAIDAASFWRMLLDGVDAVGEIPPDRWNAAAWHSPAARAGHVITTRGGFVENPARFDHRFFGISAREAAQIDPQQRMMIEVSWQALEDAGMRPRQLAGSRTGVYAGVSTADYRAMQAREPRLVGPYSELDSTAFMVANRISYLLDLRGTSLSIDAACASSLLAVQMACRAIWAGDEECALAGGVNAILSPQTSISYSLAGMLSPTGACKPFDASADGYVRSEGAVVLVLKPLARARADRDRIYALIRGMASNHGGLTEPSWMAPSTEAQRALIAEALRDAGVGAREIAYVEAHGTGTVAGDAAESAAVGAALRGDRQQPCIVGSVKSNIGHLEAGAGAAGLLKAALVLRHRAVPPTLHLRELNPDIDFDALEIRVATTTETLGEDRPLFAGVSSFGIGGSNAHVILEEPPREPVSVATGNAQLFPLSAATSDALAKRALACADAFDACDDSLDDLVYTAGARRMHHPWRLACVASDRQELAAQLRQMAAAVQSFTHAPRAPRIAFIFSGMGPQWPAMGRELLDSEPVFRAAVDEFDRLWMPLAGWSIAEELRAPAETSRIGRQVQISAATNVALQLGLAALLRSWGIEPEIVTGHSVGELPAAVCAGALSLSTAARITFDRNRIVRLIEGAGRMAALGISASEAETLLAAYPAANIAAFNAPNSVTVTGPPADVEALAAAVAARGQFARVMPVDTAFHSLQLRAFRDEVRGIFGTIAPLPTSVPFLSTVSGEVADGQSLTEEYWLRNVEEPVAFERAMRNLARRGIDLFLEIGPHPVLRSAINECLVAENVAAAVVPTLARDLPDRKTLLAAAGRLYALGAPLDFERVAPAGARCVALPPYPFEGESLWNESSESRQLRLEGPPHPLLGSRLRIQHADGAEIWQSELDPTIPYLVQHRVGGQAIVPASAYIDMAAEAIGGDCELAGLEIQAALPVAAGITLQTTIDRQKKTFAVHALRGSEWTLHASGSFASREPAGMTFDELHDGRTITRAEERASQRRAGFDFQEAFDTIESLRIEGEEGFADCRVEGAEGGPRLLLFDTATLAAGAIARQTSDALQVPVGVARLFVADHVPPRFTVRARRVSGTSRENLYDLAAFDEQGELLLAISGFRTRILSSNDAAMRDLLFVPRWIEAEPPPAEPRRESAVFRGDDCMQFIERLRTGGEQHLTLVTRGAHAVVDGDVCDPDQAALWGIARVVMQEMPSLQLRAIDLPRQPSAADLAALEDELILPADEEIAIRGTRRYTLRVVEAPAFEPPPAIRAAAAYLVTGGLGGFGFEVARWLADEGAGRVVLLSRSKPDAAREREIAALPGVVAVQGDVADADDLARVLDAIDLPLRGVFHAAGVLRDGLAAEMTRESLEEVMRPKIDGARNLDALTKHLPLDCFVLFSSVAALYGSPAQANYAAANAWLDAMAHARRAAGLPATSINFGPLADAGMSVRQNVTGRFAQRGFPAVPLNDAIAAMAAAMGGSPQVAVMRMDREAYREFHRHSGPSRFSALVVAAPHAAEPEFDLTSRLIRQVSLISGDNLVLCSTDTPLRSLGFDSLMSVELQNWIRRELGIRLGPLALAHSVTVGEVATQIHAMMAGGGE